VNHAGETSIELGIFHLHADGDSRFDPPWRAGQLLRWVRRWRPVLLAAVMMALVVASLAGGATSAHQPLTPLWTVPGTGATSQVLVGPQDLYVANEAAPGWNLAAHRLSDGALRWVTSLDHQDSQLMGLLFGEAPAVSIRRLDGEVTTVLDPDTGNPWWTRLGSLYGTVLGDRVLLRRVLPAVDRAGGSAQQFELVAVELRTGEVAWRIPAQGGERVLFGWVDGADMWQRWERPPYLLTLGGDGRLTRYDALTGEIVAAAGAALPPAGPAPPATWWSTQQPAYRESFVASYLNFVDGLAVLADSTGELVAYDGETLAPRWRLPDRLVAVPCGSVVCVAADDTMAGLVGIDRSTGAQRWSWECGEHDPPAQHCSALPTALGPDGPLLVLQWVVGAEVDSTTAWVVEPVTGEVIADLRRWRLLERDRVGGASWLLVWSDGAVPRPTLFEPSTPMWLARLTVDPVRLEVLGLVDARWCALSSDFLLCAPSAGGAFEVQRIG
jgi:outer membrane protein assembly factor BamB